MRTFEACPISLTTDFGTDSEYVGIMKGVILSLNPKATIVDVTHSIPSYDILAGALLLRQAYPYFPSAIHLVVVDPGVGSSRRPIAVITEKHVFVGPDNGVFAPVLEKESPLGVVELNEHRFFLTPTSRTFHGRDIFAPVAAHLSLGVAPHSLGRQIRDMIELEIPNPKISSDGSVVGAIMRVDKFGNLITNISPALLNEVGICKQNLAMRIANFVVQTWVGSYAEGDPSKPIVVEGSSGFLEISVKQDSAAEILRISAYEQVVAYKKRDESH